MKISACIIVKNEEKCLAKCLASLQQVVDEIIVVDTGSTDNSIKVARNFNAQVYEYVWQHDFAAAKNFAKSKATGEWIIFLDADEYFANDNIRNLRNIIKANETICDALMFKMINVDEDNNNEYLDEFFSMRAFKNIPELQFRNKIHEELVNINGPKTRLLKIDEGILLYHSGYSKNKIADKCKRNLDILLRQLTGTENDKFLYRYLADAYNGLDEYDKALYYAKLDVATGRKELAYASRSYRIINMCLEKTNAKAEERKNWYKKSIQAFPELPDFYGQYGYYLYTLDEYAEAAEQLIISFNKCQTYSGLETSTFPNNIIDYYVVFANIAMLKNNYDIAMTYYLQALNINKYYTPAFFAWTKAMLSIYKNEQVREKLCALYSSADYQFVAENIAVLTQGEIYDLFAGRDKESSQVQSVAADYQLNLLIAALAMFLKGETSRQLYFPAAIQNIIDAYKGERILQVKDFDVYYRVVSYLPAFNIDEEILNKLKQIKNEFTDEQIKLIKDIWGSH